MPKTRTTAESSARPDPVEESITNIQEANRIGAAIGNVKLGPAGKGSEEARKLVELYGHSEETLRKFRQINEAFKEGGLDRLFKTMRKHQYALPLSGLYTIVTIDECERWVFLKAAAKGGWRDSDIKREVRIRSGRRRADRREKGMRGRGGRKAKVASESEALVKIEDLAIQMTKLFTTIHAREIVLPDEVERQFQAATAALKRLRTTLEARLDELRAKAQAVAALNESVKKKKSAKKSKPTTANGKRPAKGSTSRRRSSSPKG